MHIHRNILCMNVDTFHYHQYLIFKVCICIYRVRGQAARELQQRAGGAGAEEEGLAGRAEAGAGGAPAQVCFQRFFLFYVIYYIFIIIIIFFFAAFSQSIHQN